MTGLEAGIIVSMAIKTVGAVCTGVDVMAGSVAIGTGLERTVAALAADLEAGTSLAADALATIPDTERLEAREAANHVLESIVGGALAESECDKLVTLVRKGYADNELSLTEVRRLTRELKALAAR